jgi:hypothetical protein
MIVTGMSKIAIREKKNGAEWYEKWYEKHVLLGLSQIYY